MEPDARPSKGYTRRKNMKKLNRAGRAKLKKRKEVIAAAEASGEDVTEALKKAGLLTTDGPKESKADGDGKPLDEQSQQQSEKSLQSEKQAKARKRIEKLKASKRQKKGLEASGTVGRSTAQEMWADVLWTSYKDATRHGHRQSTGFVPSAVHPASPVPITALERALLQKETRASGLSTAPSTKAQPQVLFISPSALGALDCLKNCQTLHHGCPIAKLFAKHMKVPEQAAYLQEHPVNVAIGTPNRLLKLAVEGHLDVSGVTVVIFDFRKNPKQQSMVDIPDVAGDLWGLWERFFMGDAQRSEVQLLIVCD